MNRQEDLRKKEYVPQCPQEEFIVPLLKESIETNIRYIIEQNNIKKVLDVGAGSMPFKNFVENLNVNYYSLDPNENQNPNFIGEIDGDISEVIKKNGKYDFIICTEVLEHVANWDKAFKNLFDLLSEDGFILLTAPHFYSLHEVPYDFWRPTPYAFSYFAEKNNLKVLKIDLIGSFWDMLGTLIANTPRIFIKENKITLRNKISIRLFNFILNVFYKNLKNRYFENNFIANCFMYQSNVVILNKEIKH